MSPSSPTRPRALAVNPDNIPPELRALPQWVAWRYTEEIDPETGDSDFDKPPVNARTGSLASATDPGTWADFGTALAAYRDPENGLDGVGFVPWRLPGDDSTGIVAVDLDHCREPQSGRLETWASSVLDELPAYAELSPSATGVRLFCLGKLPPNGRKKGAFEVYETSHYVTVTGQRLPGRPAGLLDLREQLLAVHRRFFPPAREGASAPPPPHSAGTATDEEIIRLASESRAGPAFRELWVGNWSGYPSQSEADLALCNYLAFFCGPDEQRIADLFARSGLFRSKWKRDDYRQRTVRKALQGRTEFYGSRNGERYTATGAGGNGAQASRPNADNSTDPLDQDATAHDLILANATIRFAWQGWLPLGVLTILASEPGVGKTRFCADLARRIYLGLPWPDGAAATFPPGSVTLWVPADNQHVELGSLPTAFGFPPTALYLNATRRNPFAGTMLDHPTDLGDFEARIRRVKPALVFVDTSLNATDRTSHKPEDAKAFFVPLQQIAGRAGVVLMCVTHLNASGKPLGRRVMGQGRVVLQLENPDPDQPNRRKLCVVKSNCLLPSPLGVTMSDGGNTYDTNPPEKPEEDGSGPREPQITQAVQKTADWLREQLKAGPRRVSELRRETERLGISSKTLYAAVRLLNLEEYEAANRKWWRLRPQQQTD
jgi:hypothetical protein